MSTLPGMSKRSKGGEPSLRYEDAVAQIESIIERIESGETGLDETIRACESGLKLIQQCRGVLDAAEQRIAELTADEGGRLREASAAGEVEVEAEDADDADFADEEDGQG